MSRSIRTILRDSYGVTDETLLKKRERFDEDFVELCEREIESIHRRMEARRAFMESEAFLRTHNKKRTGAR